MADSGAVDRPRPSLAKSRLAASRTLIIALTAQVAQSGAGLMLVPFMVTRLSSAEVGIWYVFMAVQGLAIIVDFGFQPAFARAFAAAFAGAPALQKRGVSAVAQGGEPNLQLVAEILHTGRKLYLRLALGIFLALVLFGLPAMTWLAHRDGLAVGEVQIAWALFALAVALTIYFQWISPLLIGSNAIESNYIYLVLSRASYALVAIGVLLAGGRLIALALSLLASLVVARLAARWFTAPVFRRIAGHTAHDGRLRETLAALSPNAVRMGTVMICGFLITRFSMFAVAASQPLAVSSSYGLSLQLFTALSAASQIPMHVSTSRFVAARVARDNHALRRLFIQTMGLLVAVFVTGALCVVLIVPAGLAMIESNVALIPLPSLILLAVVVFLETQHSGAAFVITTGNEVPFLTSAVICGIAVAVLVSAVSWAGYGIWAVILSQGLVQLAYNNWKWPLQAWREMRA